MKHGVVCCDGTKITNLFEFLKLISPCWWQDVFLANVRTVQVTLLQTFQLEVSLNKGCLLSSCFFHRLYAQQVKLWPLPLAKPQNAPFWDFLFHSALHSLGCLWVQIFWSSPQFRGLWVCEFPTWHFSGVFSRDAELSADSLGRYGMCRLPRLSSLVVTSKSWTETPLKHLTFLNTY